MNCNSFAIYRTRVSDVWVSVITVNVFFNTTTALEHRARPCIVHFYENRYIERSDVGRPPLRLRIRQCPCFPLLQHGICEVTDVNRENGVVYHYLCP